MRSTEIPFETPWLATYSAEKNALGLHDKQGYSTWLPTQFSDGDRVMIIALPLVTDSPAYHAAAFRYYWSTVLPILAEDMGEANLDQAHDVLAKQFLLKKAAPKRRGGYRVKRQSTAMEAMLGPHFCEFIDRVIVWATGDRGLIIPMADKKWKVHQASPDSPAQHVGGAR